MRSILTILLPCAVVCWVAIFSAAIGASATGPGVSLILAAYGLLKDWKEMIAALLAGGAAIWAARHAYNGVVRAAVHQARAMSNSAERQAIAMLESADRQAREMRKSTTAMVAQSEAIDRRELARQVAETASLLYRIRGIAFVVSQQVKAEMQAAIFGSKHAVLVPGLAQLHEDIGKAPPKIVEEFYKLAALVEGLSAFTRLSRHDILEELMLVADNLTRYANEALEGAEATPPSV